MRTQVLEVDIEFMIGKIWINLAQTMKNDEIAREPQEDFE